jgi:hypothetical protein
MPRKTAPKVKGGVAQRKNNWVQTADTVFLAGTATGFERRRPGADFKHLIRKTDLEAFIALLPDWDELAIGLELVILDSGEAGADGWHAPGTIGIGAWERQLWIDYRADYVQEHQWILDRLGVLSEPVQNGTLVLWTEETARAFQLLHVFLHELGHHHDRMSTRPKYKASRGESYAETYANRFADQIWEAYETHFGW